MPEFVVARRELDARLARTATRAILTISQLRTCGLGDSGVRHRVRAGTLFRLHRGVYSLIAEDQLDHLARGHAAVLALGPGSRLSSHSSAAVWKYRPPHDGPRHVANPAPGRRRRDGLIVHEGGGDSRDHAFREGIPLIGAARTLLDIAPDLTTEEVQDAIREALQLRCVTLPQLHDVLARNPGHRGHTRLAEAVAYRETGARESKLEDLAWDFFVEAGLPLPEANVTVGNRRVDYLWRAQQLIVECDSREFHDEDDAFETDRERDIEHLIDGHVTVRITHRKLTRGRVRLAAQLGRLVARHP